MLMISTKQCGNKALCNVQIVSRVNKVRDAGDGDKHVLNVSPCSKIASSTRVYCLDANVGLLAPYNMTFGFAAAFLNQYANAHVLDINQVGWFTALLVSSGFLFSSVSGCLGKHTGVPKAVPMLLGYVYYRLLLRWNWEATSFS
eukprot:m.399469 g.399469  ORF g.399469 m.399469 type:complete len:144 (+) comp21147_c1_seq11:1142-1573(+)